ncbi:MAG: glycosyltransferase family 4 protein, partial [Candidatus Eremiobacteraeota bacterium]|nr:glycosyltransferase family 4 protein [Candidatus Eremiobacteraeota bacterium]
MPRLLFLNWRDPWHPQSGGAELVTLRVAEGLIEKGWSVEWFSAIYQGASPAELRNGINFVRAGSQYTVHFEAFRFYGVSPPFDYVVDGINTIPFFTPLYCRIPKIAFFHQLAREVWFYETPFPANVAGYFAEPIYLRPYRNMPIIAVSDSTAESLRAIGLAGPISVIPLGVDEPPEPNVPLKDANKNIAVLCRLSPSKRIEECIKGAAIMVKGGWNGTLFIMGSGNSGYHEKLEKLVTSYNLNARVRLLGRVSNAERTSRLQDASAIWMTSIREGWGLVITEAARHATPAVVYNVPGLRDSVMHNVTGFVVEARPDELARATLRLFGLPHQQMCFSALENSRQRTWR